MKTFRLQISWLAVLFISLLASAAYGQITPLGDSSTNTGDSTKNYGAQTTLVVDGASQITYIQFPLSSIPSGASVSQATLKLYVNSVSTAGSFNVDYVNGAWAESTIDASNAPALGTTIASGVSVTTADKNQYILINVTSAVQAWLDGSETNNGIALVANSTFNATFDSKENTATSHPAELDIAYAGGDGTITGVTTAGGSGLSGGGTSGTLNLSLTKACATSQVLQWNGSTWACSNAGTGTITGVTAGAGLTGGGTGGNVTLNLNTSQVPLLASNNTFTGGNSFGGGSVFGATNNFPLYSWSFSPGYTAITGYSDVFSGQTSGVEGVTGDSTGFGVFGINVGTAGGSVGVYGTTNDPTGTGVSGYNPNGNGVFGSSSSGNGVVGTSSTGNAMVANGNASQSLSSGGWVKGMVYVNGSTAPYNIVRCYNSTLTGVAATTPPCGYTLTEVQTAGNWEVNFGFEVDNRIWTATLASCGCVFPASPSIYADWINPTTLYVLIWTGSGAAPTSYNWNFTLVVY
jgi:hypothetical protein